MRRKVNVFGMAVVLALALQVAAGVVAQGTTTLTVMHNWDPASDPKGTALAAIFDAFVAANPDVEITQEIFPDSEIPVKVETSFLAGQEPDVIFSNIYPATQAWADAGVIVPVNEWIEAWGLADSFRPVAIEDWTDAEGRILAFPLEGFVWPLWANMTAMDAAGVSVPTTLEQLIDIAPALREAGYVPYTTAGAADAGYKFFWLVVQGNMEDPEFIDLVSHGGLAESAKARAAVELFVKVRDSEVLPENVEGMKDSDMNSMFFTGKAAMIFQGSWSFGQVPPELVENVALSGFPLPEASTRAGGPMYYSSYKAKGVWVTPNGQEKLDAVRRLVQFLYQPENIARFVKVGMAAPTNNVTLDEGSVHPLFLKSLDLDENNSVAALQGPYFPASVDSELRRIVAGAFIPDKMTADEIIGQIDEAYQKLQ